MKPGPPEQMTARKGERSIARARAVLIIAAVVVPLLGYVTLERQARRLDALADHGRTTDAQVTHLTSGGGTIHYAYRVDGNEHHWSVVRDEAPYEVGQAFTVTYLPEDPALSRPVADRTLVAEEAVQNRSFSWKLALVVFLFLGSFALGAHLELRQARTHGIESLSGAEAFRRRIAVAAVAVAPALVSIAGFHLRETLEQGESIWSVVIALVVTFALIIGVFVFLTRKGPEEAPKRATRLLRWLAPLSLLFALMTLLAVAFAR